MISSEFHKPFCRFNGGPGLWLVERRKRDASRQAVGIAGGDVVLVEDTGFLVQVGERRHLLGVLLDQDNDQ